MTPLIIGGFEIEPGERRLIELPIAKLYTDIDVNLPIHVIRGRRDGPTVFVSAAIHGDELNGIEIIRRLLKGDYRGFRGTLIAVPMVNVYGVLAQTRYMPDRRDLNRAFPGSRKGSLAGRLADLFTREIVAQSDYGIDLHTGAIHRSNLPQIRGNMDDEVTRELGQVFGAPVLLNSDLRDGSLRQVADEMGVKMLLYEAGEALRFDEICIRAGLRGVENVLRHLGMFGSRRKPRKMPQPVLARDSGWVRATGSGLVIHHRQLGDSVEAGERLAEITSPSTAETVDVMAPRAGIIIGKQQIPLVQDGEAMYHIAYFRRMETATERVEAFQTDFQSELEAEDDV
ncbi:succinylglutamate desuccinylase/aspartoacylase family protein [Natronospirillum operosum]|uniref:Succinylglutamate desuccinylase/aspartoacylase family protein n=1 Tax=Natronospirillum operosum TaxID=2759953 RepID=A0A4Z0W7H2_9GAMM|nr:succinylglutamate desuccinylase/aspartoacylase family protein [Natronospirillum operosum]TGG94004.1 succinylglutamate desuccinylase/aspartoacylase family protein [Natronospirillum operosum]